MFVDVFRCNIYWRPKKQQCRTGVQVRSIQDKQGQDAAPQDIASLWHPIRAPGWQLSRKQKGWVSVLPSPIGRYLHIAYNSRLQINVPLHSQLYSLFIIGMWQIVIRNKCCESIEKYGYNSCYLLHTCINNNYFSLKFWYFYKQHRAK